MSATNVQVPEVLPGKVIAAAIDVIAAAIDRLADRVCKLLEESNRLKSEQLKVAIQTAGTAKQQVEMYERDIRDRSDPKILAERMRQGVELAMNGMQPPDPPVEVVGARLPRHGHKTAMRVEMPKQPGEGA